METTLAVLQAMALIEGQGPGYPSEEIFRHLRRLGLRPSRVREFLTAQGRIRPEKLALPHSIHEQIAGCPDPMQAEVAAWVEVLEGRWGRGGARHSDTIGRYVNAVMPALVEWSTSCVSLREIATDEAEGQLASLTGSRRVLTAVALRSLFSALKARRRIFVDPARSVRARRLPQTSVLRLDASSRSSLLRTLVRSDHRLVVLLAGVHAMTRADIIGSKLEEVDLDASTIKVRGTSRPLSPAVEGHVIDWLRVRAECWPRSANPHLLVTGKSAYGVG